MAHSLLTRPDFVGFDRIFDLFERQASTSTERAFPPYNVVRVDDNEYRVDLAVAGFAEEELDVLAEGSTLTVESRRDFSASGGGEQHLHKGIAERNFRRQFTLADTIKVRGADLVNGILSVYLQNVVPEEERPQRVEIGSGNSRGVFAKAKELLTE